MTTGRNQIDYALHDSRVRGLDRVDGTGGNRLGDCMKISALLLVRPGSMQTLTYNPDRNDLQSCLLE